METYQNGQICYKRGNMEEVSIRRLPRSLPKSDLDLNNLHIQKHSNDFKTEKSFTNKVRVLRNKKCFQKVKDINNKRLPNEEK